jgi:hypothetical protein
MWTIDRRTIIKTGPALVDLRTLRRSGAFTALDYGEVLKKGARCAAALRASELGVDS